MQPRLRTRLRGGSVDRIQNALKAETKYIAYPVDRYPVDRYPLALGSLGHGGSMASSRLAREADQGGKKQDVENLGGGHGNACHCERDCTCTKQHRHGSASKVASAAL